MIASSKKIICVHLLNDYSGSPLVFSQAIQSLLESGASIELYTNYQQGFLSDIEQVKYHRIPYQWSKNTFLTLCYFFYAQLWLWLTLIHKYRNEPVTIYINTILPFGAALAGLWMKQRVIYHLHETSVKPQIFKHFLFWMVARGASEVIYVSNYLKEAEPLPTITSHLVYNTLSESFMQRVAHAPKRPPLEGFHVLMLCSLKVYKGVWEYVELARSMPQYHFSLVLNSSWDEITYFFRNEPIWPDNLAIYPAQSDIHPFFQQADLVVNLSHPEAWVETFGMTILEGMAYGLPAIVPPVGGVTELIEHDWNGYHIHPKNLAAIYSAIQTLATQPELYHQFSRQCFHQRINQVILNSLNLRKSFRKRDVILNNFDISI